MLTITCQPSLTVSSEKKHLTSLDVGLEGFTIYPPLSGLDTGHLMLPLTELPDRLGDLSSLESLRINGSRIERLPSSITRLKKLAKLDLSMSYNLVIIKELDKLKQLPMVRLLNIYDVVATEEDISLLKNSLEKDVKIITTTEEFLEGYDN